jgi:hypothetical protein
MKDFVPGRPYWWQWPTVLSLDAPAVALLWQWQLTRVAQVTQPWFHAFILGAGVWLAYAADRWLEGWRLQPGQVRTQRHWFYQRCRWPVAGLWTMVLISAISIAFMRLTSRELIAGFLLLGPVLAYLLSHQLIHRASPWRAPKELCVALLLAGGVACFLLATHPTAIRTISVPLALFGLLCLANCSLISWWEHEVDRSHGQNSLALQYPASRRLLHLLPWLIALLATGFALRETGALRTATFAAAASGILLGAVDRLHARCGRQLARSLADVALMTPLIAGLLQFLPS